MRKCASRCARSREKRAGRSMRLRGWGNERAGASARRGPGASKCAHGIGNHAPAGSLFARVRLTLSARVTGRARKRAQRGRLGVEGEQARARPSTGGEQLRGRPRAPGARMRASRCEREYGASEQERGAGSRVPTRERASAGKTHARASKSENQARTPKSGRATASKPNFCPRANACGRGPILGVFLTQRATASKFAR